MRDSPFGRRRPRTGRRLLLAAFVLGVLGFAGWFLISGTSRPTARWVDPVETIGRSTPLTVEIEAGRAGLASYEVVAQKPDGSPVMLAEETFPRTGMLGGEKHQHSASLRLEAERLGLKEGPLQISVFAEDHSPLAMLRPRRPLLEMTAQVDLTPPNIRELGEIRWINRGGSDLALFEVSEDATRAGIEVAGAFFPGVPIDGLPPTTRAALYAIPYDSQSNPTPLLVAEDKAGNRRTVDLPVHVKDKVFPTEEITISDEFVQSTIVAILTENQLAPMTDPVEAFLRVNRDLRQTSETRLAGITADPSTNLQIDGAFRQQPGTRVGSRFAERRTYRYNGQVVDEQTHLGYDLASTQQAPVLAAQAGTVDSVDNLGIYGRSVVIDHGLGLHSLYAHLSSAEVNPGDRVEQGQSLGRSGQSGLAAGDHLHFSVLVHGTHVDALEWWDPKWVRLHVLEPIAAVRTAAGAAPGQAQPATTDAQAVAPSSDPSQPGAAASPAPAAEASPAATDAASPAAEPSVGAPAG